MTRGLRSGISALLLLCGLALTLAEAAVLPLPVWLRTLVALVFLGAAPGHGWVWALRLSSRSVELALAVFLSLALSLLVTMALVASGFFDIVTITLVLAGIGLVGAVTWLLLPEGARKEAAI